MKFCSKCKRCIDSIFITFLTLLILGVTCGILLTAILVLMRLPISQFNTSIITWVIVAFCISIVVFFYALIFHFCKWRHSKLFMGIIFALFCIFLLICGFGIYDLKSEAINDIGKFWSTSSLQNAIVEHIESFHNCCGFDENTNNHCNSNNQTSSSIGELCKDAINSSMNLLFIVIVSLAAIFLIITILTFVSSYRQFKQPDNPELTDIQSSYAGPAVWY